MGLPGEAVTKMQRQHLRERRRRSSGQGRGRRDRVREAWCNEVVSSLQPQVSQHSSCLKFFEEKGPHLCLICPAKTWPLQKAKTGKRKDGSFCEKEAEGKGCCKSEVKAVG